MAMHTNMIAVETKAVSVGLKTPKLVAIEEVCQTVCSFQTIFHSCSSCISLINIYIYIYKDI